MSSWAHSEFVGTQWVRGHSVSSWAHSEACPRILVYVCVCAQEVPPLPPPPRQPTLFHAHLGAIWPLMHVRGWPHERRLTFAAI